MDLLLICTMFVNFWFSALIWTHATRQCGGLQASRVGRPWIAHSSSTRTTLVPTCSSPLIHRTLLRQWKLLCATTPSNYQPVLFRRTFCQATWWVTQFIPDGSRFCALAPQDGKTFLSFRVCTVNGNKFWRNISLMYYMNPWCRPWFVQPLGKWSNQQLKIVNQNRQAGGSGLFQALCEVYSLSVWNYTHLLVCLLSTGHTQPDWEGPWDPGEESREVGAWNCVQCDRQHKQLWEDEGMEL